MIDRLTKTFRGAEHGSLSVEAVFAFPMMVIAITMTFVIWDAFKTLNSSQNATYTVADMLSRQTTPVDADYLTSMHEIFNFLSDGAGGNALRVSVVTMTEDPETLVRTKVLVWSKGVGGINGYADLKPLGNRVPDMAVGDELIVVESEQNWAPAFNVGLSGYRFRDVEISRPRFAPQLVWSDV